MRPLCFPFQETISISWMIHAPSRREPCRQSFVARRTEAADTDIKLLYVECMRRSGQ
ncbi:hypothetical protein KI387_022492 [Taxus chinensis]|uniref:Uncharacterized protein n=1 Tax=Taxus chinensis TaxID=29808 RepID=A0AA38LA28_TAXCH|nr:hypothetical protein KI387_022492 [Taxus chinensis]